MFLWMGMLVVPLLIGEPAWAQTASIKRPSDEVARMPEMIHPVPAWKPIADQRVRVGGMVPLHPLLQRGRFFPGESGGNGRSPARDDREAMPAQTSRRTPPKWTAREKLIYGAKRAFLSPGTYILPALSTTIIQLRERPQPQKDRGDKVADALSRYAIQWGTTSSKRFLTSGLYPIIFHQDPRYRPSRRRGFGARLLHAMSRVFVTESRDGRWRVNIAQLGGDLTASALANLWERNTPGHQRIGVGPTFRRFGIMVGLDVVAFVLGKEFWPDIKKKLLRK